MKQRRQRPLFSVVILLWAVAVVTTSFLPSTFARFNAGAAVTAGARVAAWGPELRVADAWGRIAFVIPDSYSSPRGNPSGWLAITDGPRINDHTRNMEWAFRPNNVNSDVAARFRYSLVATGAHPWVHFDVGNIGAINVVGTYANFRTDDFAPGADIPTMTPPTPRQELFVYLNHIFRPFDPVNCYARMRFHWTIEQID